MKEVKDEDNMFMMLGEKVNVCIFLDIIGVVVDLWF